MINNLLKGEIYSNILTVRKTLQTLKTQRFPTKGASDLTELLNEIIDIMISRFDKYNSRNLIFIKKKLLTRFGEYCGYLSASRLENIPWSIIPAYEKLFKSIYPDFEFILCPRWEVNYSINEDTLDNIKNFILKTPSLLFDGKSQDEIDIKVETFLENYPSGLYFIFYPKHEKLSALHFSLLGHEIGHIYSTKWLNNNYEIFLTETNLKNEIKKIAEENFKKESKKMTLYKEVFISKTSYEYEKYIKLILNELISDLFGSLIFGHTTLVASYLFSNGLNLDDHCNWKTGHLSWRFRLQNIWELINYIDTKTGKPFKHENQVWGEIIKEIKRDSKDIVINEYISVFLHIYKQHRERIVEEIQSSIEPHVYSNFLSNIFINEAIQRIKNCIPPNAYWNSSNIETPIDFRNILFGTWLSIFEKIEANHTEYEIRSKRINLLSIKGIELSIEQENYNDFIETRD